MNSINSSHAAGHAAYTRQTHSSQEAEQAQSEEADAASSKQDAPKDTFQSTAEDDLSAQEREMIKDNFPEDPELSMRLYGRSRDAQTVNPDTLGNNLDMTG